MYCSIDNLKKHTALLNFFFFLREISRETGALHPSWLKDSNERSTRFVEDSLPKTLHMGGKKTREEVPHTFCLLFSDKKNYQELYLQLNSTETNVEQALL